MSCELPGDQINHSKRIRANLFKLLNRVIYIFALSLKASALFDFSALQTTVANHCLHKKVSILAAEKEYKSFILIPKDSFLLCFLSQCAGKRLVERVCSKDNMSMGSSVQAKVWRLLISISYGAERI